MYIELSQENIMLLAIIPISNVYTSLRCDSETFRMYLTVKYNPTL